MNQFQANMATSFAVLLCLAGCGAMQTLKDGTVNLSNAVFFSSVKKLKLDLVARHALNQHDRAQPLSVVVRVYQLKDAKNFQAASYPQLLSDDKATLGADLLAVKEVVVLPGATVSLDENMNENATQIGVMALFRPLNRDTVWRTQLAKDNLDNDEAAKLELIDHKIHWSFIPHPGKE